MNWQAYTGRQECFYYITFSVPSDQWPVTKVDMLIPFVDARVGGR